MLSYFENHNCFTGSMSMSERRGVFLQKNRISAFPKFYNCLNRHNKYLKGHFAKNICMTSYNLLCNKAPLTKHSEKCFSNIKVTLFLSTCTRLFVPKKITIHFIRGKNTIPHTVFK